LHPGCHRSKRQPLGEQQLQLLSLDAGHDTNTSSTAGRIRFVAMDMHPGEEIVFEGHPSWRALLLFYLSGVAIAAVALVIGVLASGWALGVVLGVVTMAFLVLAGFVKRMATRYVISTERLHIRRGLLSKSTQETRVQRVQNVNTAQTLFQRVMRIGTVEFDTAGTDDSEFRFVGVADPADVVRAVDRAQRAASPAPSAADQV
jgi:uncharacterized membrane protein YdbT with pleckstrin-like domain